MRELATSRSDHLTGRADRCADTSRPWYGLEILEPRVLLSGSTSPTPELECFVQPATSVEPSDRLEPTAQDALASSVKTLIAHRSHTTAGRVPLQLRRLGVRALLNGYDNLADLLSELADRGGFLKPIAIGKPTFFRVPKLFSTAASGCVDGRAGPTDRDSSRRTSADGSDVVTITDHGGLRGRTTTVRFEATAADSQFMSDLYDYAVQYFPSGQWVNVGPDASYRQIVFFSEGRKVTLLSWHPPFEANPELVAGSKGIVQLKGQSREEFLKKDDPTYVEKRQAFDEIESRIREHFK